MSVKLFVGGLPFSASVVTDRDTGRSRVFGFVEMATPEEANNAVSRLNGSNLDGRPITVEVAKPGGSGGGGQRRAGGGGGAGRGWTRGGR